MNAEVKFIVRGVSLDRIKVKDQEERKRTDPAAQKPVFRTSTLATVSLYDIHDTKRLSRFSDVVNGQFAWVTVILNRLTF